MLDLKKTLAKLLNCDYVIEEGTEGIWTYRKWASGIAECWGIYSWNITGYNTWGNLYYSTYTGHILYPTNLFIDRPSEVVNLLQTNGDGWVCRRNVSNSSTQTANYFMIRPTTASADIAYITVQAKGFWKTFAPIENNT